MKKALFQLALSFAIAIAALPSHAFTTKAQYAVLLDADTGTVLFEKNADEAMTPSSMTKLMTVYVVFERISKGIFIPEDTFRVSEKAWKKGGSKMFVKHTDMVAIKDLLHGVIVQSGNDACIVLAEGISSTEEEFANLMNKTGKQIGLTNSVFKNSTGWPDEGHYMSARDIATLSYHIINDFPQYYPIFAEKEFTYNGIKQSNRNSLLDRNIGVDGLKTGHTDEGGYGIAVSALQEGRRLIAVVNGLANNDERSDEAEKLLNYGYRYFENKTLLVKEQQVSDAEIWLGQEKTVPLITGEEIRLLMPKLSTDEVKIKVTYQGPLAAPVNQGDKVAQLHILIPGMKEKIYPLYAAANVAKLGWFGRAMKTLEYYAKKDL